MDVYIDNRQTKISVNNEILDIVKKVIKECLLLEKKDLDVEVSVSFVNNKDIQALNKEYRKINAPTDVLSFPIENQFDLPIVLLGDIVISLERALEQANDFGHSFLREVAYLTAHSMFHLLGYDHEKDEEKEIMRQKEKAVMKRLEIFKDEK